MLCVEPHDLGDLEHIRSILIQAARDRRVLSYSELLGRLGYRFSRPKMRALCSTLGSIDRAAAVNEPPLAVLVVRESDRLPGQGWWVGQNGPTSSSAQAKTYVAKLQEAAFEFWRRASRDGRSDDARERSDMS